jgi:hypothetical protein
MPSFRLKAYLLEHLNEHFETSLIGKLASGTTQRLERRNGSVRGRSEGRTPQTHPKELWKTMETKIHQHIKMTMLQALLESQ